MSMHQKISSMNKPLFLFPLFWCCKTIKRFWNFRKTAWMKGYVFSLKEHRLLISLAPVVNGKASLLLTLSDKISSSKQSS